MNGLSLYAKKLIRIFKVDNDNDETPELLKNIRRLISEADNDKDKPLRDLEIEDDEDSINDRIEDLHQLMLDTKELIRKRTNEIMYEPTPMNRCNMTENHEFNIKSWFIEVRNVVIGTVVINFWIITITFILHLIAMWFMLNHFLG